MEHEHPHDEAQQDTQKAEWQTPEIIVEDVETTTRGGPVGDVDPIDDAWYT